MTLRDKILEDMIEVIGSEEKYQRLVIKATVMLGNEDAEEDIDAILSYALGDSISELSIKRFYEDVYKYLAVMDEDQHLLEIHRHMGKEPYDALVLWATHLVDGVDSTLRMHEDNYLTIYDKHGYVNHELIDHLELEFVKAMEPNAYGYAFNRFYADIREQLLEMHSS